MTCIRLILLVSSACSFSLLPHYFVWSNGCAAILSVIVQSLISTETHCMLLPCKPPLHYVMSANTFHRHVVDSVYPSQKGCCFFFSPAMITSNRSYINPVGYQPSLNPQKPMNPRQTYQVFARSSNAEVDTLQALFK